MPPHQGALYWPARKDNRVTLLDETCLPFADASFNQVLLVHLLEHTGAPELLMQELWRVLVPGGRVIALVPNRLGLWSHSAKTPFGYGRPFSAHQMKELFAAAKLTFTRAHSMLYLPPATNPAWIQGMKWFEYFGEMFLPRIGGVLVVEAEKQIYAATMQPVRAAKAYPRRAVAGATVATHSSNTSSTVDGVSN